MGININKMDRIEVKRKEISYIDIVFIIGLFVIVFINIWKAYIGTNNADEAYYLTLGYRLVQGDAILAEDWFLCCLGIIFYPLIYIYRCVVGSNEGIVLYFRFLYCLFTSIVGIAIYLKYRKYKFKAALSSWFYMLFTIYGLATLSYNTMPIMFLVLACILYSNTNNVARFFSGIFYSCAVLCAPYLVALFPIYLLLIFCFKQDIKRSLYFFFGIATMFIIFVYLCFSRSDLKSIIYGMTHSVNSSHNQGLIYLFFRNCGSIILHFNVTLIGYFILLFIFIKKKGKVDISRFTFYAVLVTVLNEINILFIDKFQASLGGYMTMMLPITICGFIVIVINDIRKIDLDIVVPFFVAISESVLVGLFSNGGLRTLCGPLIIPASLTFLLIDYSKINKYVDICFCVGNVLLMLFYRVTFNYRGIKNSDNNILITVGPYKGIKSDSSEMNTMYYEFKDFADDYRNRNVAFVFGSVWEYLVLEDNRISIYSTYIAVEYKEEYLQILNDYYSHTNKLPVYLYVSFNNELDITKDDINFCNAQLVEERPYGWVIKVGE